MPVKRAGQRSQSHQEAEGRLAGADPMAAADLLGLRPSLMLALYPDDLLLAEATAFHCPSPFSRRTLPQFCWALGGRPLPPSITLFPRIVFSLPAYFVPACFENDRAVLFMLEASDFCHQPIPSVACSLEELGLPITVLNCMSVTCVMWRITDFARISNSPHTPSKASARRLRRCLRTSRARPSWSRTSIPKKRARSSIRR